MRVLYVYCHPLEASFHGGLRRAATEALSSAGHAVDLLDLYAEGFDPVLSAEGRRRYHDCPDNQAGLESHVARLRRAEALVVQFPTWCFGPPALLKGYFDRVFMPGVAFDLAEPAKVRPLLGQIRHLVGVSTYGRPRSHAFWVGDPPRKLVTRYLRWFVAEGAKVRYEALYHMNVASAGDRARFLQRVVRVMRKL